LQPLLNCLVTSLDVVLVCPLYLYWSIHLLHMRGVVRLYNETFNNLSSMSLNYSFNIALGDTQILVFVNYVWVYRHFRRKLALFSGVAALVLFFVGSWPSWVFGFACFWRGWFVFESIQPRRRSCLCFVKIQYIIIMTAKLVKFYDLSCLLEYTCITKMVTVNASVSHANSIYIYKYQKKILLLFPNLDCYLMASFTPEFFLVSCDSNQVPKWFGTHYNLEVPL